MRKIVAVLSALTVWLLCLAPAQAQEDGKGFLTRTIQDALSGAGRTVSIDGFEGLLSSTASFDRLTIADDEGIWLTIENAELEWNRSALLRGRLEVEKLTASRLDLPRLPIADPELPDAEAAPFSLPELPVSVEIAEFGVDEINLGAPLLGEEAQLRLAASATYTDDVLDVALTAERTDAKRGSFEVRANLERSDNILDLLVRLDEGPEGIAARLLNLPDQPPVALTIEGSGPIDDFTSDVRIATDGEDRLSGQVIVGTQAPRRAMGTPDRRIRADIGGDITALLAPRYREFFGDDLTLSFDALQESNGAVEVSSFELSAQAAELRGRVLLNSDLWPTFIDIDGTVANAEGTAVLLPVSGDAPSVERVDLSVDYDASEGDAFRADFDIDALTMAAGFVQSATLSLDGTLSGSPATRQEFEGLLTFDTEGLDLTDPALAEAVGSDLRGNARISFAEGDPVAISDLAFEGTGYGLTGDLVIDGIETGLSTELDLAVAATDLSRFSALAGREIAGRSQLAVAGTIVPLSGQFDVTVDGQTEDVKIGIEQADAVLDGLTSLSLAARRNETGTYVEDLLLENDALELTADAQLRTDDSDVTLNARFNDIGLVLPQYDGPVTVTAEATQDARGWTIDAATDGPYGVTLTAEGLATGPRANMAFTARVPELSRFAEGVEGPLALDGRAFMGDDGWEIEADASGPHDVTAALEGQITPALDLAFDADVPDLSAFVPQVSGPVRAQGRLQQTEEGYVIDTSLDGPHGLEAQVEGLATGPDMNLSFAFSLPDVSPYVPSVSGPLEASGTARQTPDGIRLDARANGPYEATVALQGLVTGPDLNLRFDLSLPDVAPLAPGLSGPLDASGVVRQTGEGITISADADGPEGIAATVNGALTPALDFRFSARVPQVSAFVPQISGAAELSGRVFQNENGIFVDTELDGPYGLQASVEGPVAGTQLRLAFELSMPDVSPLAPGINGPLSATGVLRQTDRGFEIDTNATGPYGARASVDGLLTGPDMRLAFDLAVPNVQPLAPGISGSLNATGVVRQTPQGIDLNASVNGPYRSRVTVDGLVTGPNAAVDFTLNMPDISPLAGQISGPLSLDGTARKAGDAWRVDTSVSGPSGTRAQVNGLVNADGTLDLDIEGSVPLGLSRPFLAPRNLQGQAVFDLQVNGPPALSSVSGTIRTTDATFTAPNLRIAIQGIAANIKLGNNRARIDVRGRSADGGTLAVNGAITLTPSLPADISIALRSLVLTDPRLYRTSLSGDLRLAGPLTGGAVIRGQINVGETEVSVPSTGLTSIGNIPPITHVNAPADVQRTRAKAGLIGEDAGDDPAADSGGGGGFGLDILVSAPSRIFVRGRGLDAELGGSLRLTGTTSNIISSGRFSLIRGRLDILGKRFTLDEGSVQFQGDFVPFIRFTTSTPTATGEVRVIVEGPADSPEVRFEATPDAPQDEVLAQLLFGRNIQDITAFQALQLASAVATLAGGGGTDVISSLREGFGLDDFDVTTTEDGATALRVGKYISENIYTDVTAASDGTGEVSLNLDITPNLKGKATLGSDGDSGIGIFYERDY